MCTTWQKKTNNKMTRRLGKHCSKGATNHDQIYSLIATWFAHLYIILPQNTPYTTKPHKTIYVFFLSKEQQIDTKKRSYTYT